MLSFLEDDSRYNAFVEGINTSDHPATDRLDIKLIEWSHGDDQGRFAKLDHVSELTARASCSFRAIFAPLDVARSSNWAGHLALLDHLPAPTAFLSERIQNVASSFGSRPAVDNNDYHTVWLHFLCKDIELDDHQKIRNRGAIGPAGLQSQADWAWHRVGFLLHWREAGAATQPVDGPEARPVTEPEAQFPFENLTMCCWGAPESMMQRFSDLAQTDASRTDMVTKNSWTSVLHDPFLALALVLDELFLLLDSQVLSLAAAFGRVERETLQLAQSHASASGNFDFVGLSNVSKHLIHLKEGSEAMRETLTALRRQHIKYFDRRRLPGAIQPRSSIVYTTEDALEHTVSMFGSTNLQLASLEKRMQNVTNLAFNLVTQRNSLAAIDDGRSMKMIAITTLIFLPFASIAALFSTPFFLVSDAPSGLELSPSFWVFWAVVLPLTAVVVGGWSVAYIVARERVREGYEVAVKVALERWWARRYSKTLRDVT